MQGRSFIAPALAIALAAIPVTTAHARVGMRWLPHFSPMRQHGEPTRPAARVRQPGQAASIGFLAVAPDEPEPTPTPTAVVEAPPFEVPVCLVPVSAPASEPPRSSGPHIIEIGHAASKPTSALPRIIYGDTPPAFAHGPKIIYGDALTSPSHGPKIIYFDTP